jgi:hypothetical protein
MKMFIYNKHNNKKEFIKIKNALKGISIDNAIVKLYEMGISITESIKLIKEYYKISLREAKDKVSNNPVWESVVAAASPIHDELINNYYELIKPQKGERISSTLKLQVEMN